MLKQIKILRKAFPDDDDVFKGIEREFLEKMDDLLQAGLDWEITQNHDIPEKKEGDRIIHMANHPTLTSAWSWAKKAQHFSPNLVGVGKEEIITRFYYRWMIGKAMKTAGKGLFVNRKPKNRDKTLEKLKEQARQVITEDTGILIFPDAHRPKASRLRKEHRKWDKRRPDLEVRKNLPLTCVPKSGGLMSILEAVEDLDNVRLFDWTIVEPWPSQQYGQRLHFDVQEIDLAEFENDLEYIREFLFKLWMRKNQIIQEIRPL